MNKQSFYYSIEPQFIKVTKEEFVKYLNSYPRSLNKDVFGVCEPPSVTYNDFELADRYPYSVVANTFLYDDDPNGYYYEPEENRVYWIMINYKEVFDSRRGEYMKLEDIIKTEKEVIADGNSIENNIIVGSDIRCIGHFGNVVSLDIWTNNCSLFSAYNNTNNIGLQIKALIELFDLTEEDGFFFSKFKNIPCRIIIEGPNRWSGKVIGFGHFMKDKFVYKEDFAKITE